MTTSKILGPVCQNQQKWQSWMAVDNAELGFPADFLDFLVFQDFLDFLDWGSGTYPKTLTLGNHSSCIQQ
jgi:hypothetical protein